MYAYRKTILKLALAFLIALGPALPAHATETDYGYCRDLNELVLTTGAVPVGKAIITQLTKEGDGRGRPTLNRLIVALEEAEHFPLMQRRAASGLNEAALPNKPETAVKAQSSVGESRNDFFDQAIEHHALISIYQCAAIDAAHRLETCVGSASGVGGPLWPGIQPLCPFRDFSRRRLFQPPYPIALGTKKSWLRGEFLFLHVRELI